MSSALATPPLLPSFGGGGRSVGEFFTFNRGNIKPLFACRPNLLSYYVSEGKICCLNFYTVPCRRPASPYMRRVDFKQPNALQRLIYQILELSLIHWAWVQVLSEVVGDYCAAKMIQHISAGFCANRWNGSVHCINIERYIFISDEGVTFYILSLD